MPLVMILVMDAVVFNTDYYSDEVIRDPIPHFAEMRRLGPVLWLPSQNAMRWRAMRKSSRCCNG